jgi:AcrR family transcriptional regulator
LARRRPRPAQAEDTRAVILDAAEALFAANGYAGTAMRDLAAEAGTSQALLHHHFGTKLELYRAVQCRLGQRYMDTAGRGLAGDASGPVPLDHAVRALLTFFQQNPAAVRLGAWARLEGAVEPWEGETELWDFARGVCARAQSLGQLRADLDARYVLVVLSEALAGWQLGAERYRRIMGLPDVPGEAAAAFADTLARVMGQGLGPTAVPAAAFEIARIEAQLRADACAGAAHRRVGEAAIVWSPSGVTLLGLGLGADDPAAAVAALPPGPAAAWVAPTAAPSVGGLLAAAGFRWSGSADVWADPGGLAPVAVPAAPREGPAGRPRAAYRYTRAGFVRGS